MYAALLQISAMNLGCSFRTPLGVLGKNQLTAIMFITLSHLGVLWEKMKLRKASCLNKQIKFTIKKEAGYY